MNQHSTDRARSASAPGAPAGKAGRPTRAEAARQLPKFYRPRFTVTPPEKDADFVPGYN